MGTSRIRTGGTLQRGFTLVELMVALSVMAIILSLAIPSFSSLLASNRMSAQTNQLIGALSLARSEAVRRAQPVTLLSDNSDNYALGWTVFPDANGNGAPASATNAADGLPLSVTSSFNSRVSIRRVTQSAPPAPFTYTNSGDSARMQVVFTARGGIAATSGAFFKICDASNTSVKGRIVQVNLVGKISLYSSNESCS